MSDKVTYFYTNGAKLLAKENDVWFKPIKNGFKEYIRKDNKWVFIQDIIYE